MLKMGLSLLISTQALQEFCRLLGELSAVKDRRGRLSR